MKKLILFLLTILSLSMAYTQTMVAADTQSAATPTQLAASLSVVKEDHRTKVLKTFLQKQHSPLADFASDLVSNADKYHLNWTLVAAISGVESTYGLAIPSNSYNAWGWGVYGDNVKRFSSWKEAIETISQGLRENYLNKGADGVYGIGKTYAASPAWADHVMIQMNEIDAFEKNWTDSTLSLTL